MKMDLQRRRLLRAAGWTAAAGAAGFGVALAANWNRIPRGFLQRMWDEAQMPVLPAPHKPNPKAWPDKGVHAAWLGHSSVLLKVDGVTILTDPVLSTRAGINLLGPVTLGVKRFVAPALEIADLPPIDLILLSHAHMDHFDIPTLRALENGRTRVVTAPQTSDLLRSEQYAGVAEVGWRQSTQAGEVEVTGLEVNHWGARLRTDTFRGYNGYLVRVGQRRILFAGDTANTHHFASLPGRQGVDLAIFPIGAYNPWIRYHCTPEQAVRMANEAGAEVVLPVHHQTFRLSDEPAWEPLERFAKALGSRGISRMGWKEIGESLSEA